MTTHPTVLDALRALTAEVQALHMAQVVQRSAYVALALRLQRQGQLDANGLAADLQLLAQVQPDEGWQSGLEEFAAALCSVGSRA